MNQARREQVLARTIRLEAMIDSATREAEILQLVLENDPLKSETVNLRHRVDGLIATLHGIQWEPQKLRALIGDVE
jgi:hypothetical protein